MSLDVGTERRTTGVTAAVDSSWRIRPEPDPTRRKKELLGMGRSFYWLLYGLNAGQLYQPDARSPFTVDTTDSAEKREFSTRLQATLTLYEGKFMEIFPEDPAGQTNVRTVLGSYQHQKLGRAAIVVTNSEDLQRIAHVWMNETPAP